MFSYRHAYHAGNHADVLKHSVLISVIKYMTEKPVPLCVIDSHAGAGLYRLDSQALALSGEAGEGIEQFLKAPEPLKSSLLQDYVSTLEAFNTGKKTTLYPGSPFLLQHYLNASDRLKLFELHPTDTRLLTQHVAQLRSGRQVSVLREDGFEGMKKFLPPKSRRGLVLMDPSYEIKSDYAKVALSIQDCLRRFETGTYIVWYPLIARAHAHDLPKRLKTLSQQARRPWMHVSLMVKSAKYTALPGQLEQVLERQKRPGLPGSGLFVINPPYTLAAQLKEAMPELLQRLGQDDHANFTLDSGG
jgi:23S rRNA (adenine2030-N6)-methyltransferase